METSEISANSRISDVLRHDEEMIITKLTGFNKNFNRLRNPVLKNLLAKRVTVAQACRIAGCTVDDFFEILKPLGFKVVQQVSDDDPVPPALPLVFENLVELDVRPVLAAGNDPLKIILDAVAGLKNGEVLKVINTFEPIPLISLLKSKGYASFLENISPELVYTYFVNDDSTFHPVTDDTHGRAVQEDDFSELVKTYKTHFIDVSTFEMPKPMIMILDKLETLPAADALYVRHRKIPVHLLPVLKERGFDFRIKETAEAVLLLIFKP